MNLLITTSFKMAENPDEIKELLEDGFEYVCQRTIDFHKKTQMNKNLSKKYTKSSNGAEVRYTHPSVKMSSTTNSLFLLSEA